MPRSSDWKLWLWVLTVPGTIARPGQAIRRAAAARGSAAISSGSPTRAIAPSIASTAVGPRARSGADAAAPGTGASARSAVTTTAVISPALPCGPGDGWWRLAGFLGPGPEPRPESIRCAGAMSRPRGSHRLGGGGQVEVVGPQHGDAHRPTLDAARDRGGAQAVAAGQHLDRRLVEPEVVDRVRDGAVLDPVHAVAGQAGGEDGLGIERAQVEEPGDQHAALDALDELVARGAAAVEYPAD